MKRPSDGAYADTFASGPHGPPTLSAPLPSSTSTQAPARIRRILRVHIHPNDHRARACRIAAFSPQKQNPLRISTSRRAGHSATSFNHLRVPASLSHPQSQLTASSPFLPQQRVQENLKVVPSFRHGTTTRPT